MSKQFLELEFTDQATIEFWDELYDRQDFSGTIYRERMGTVLSWLEGLNSIDYSRILDLGCGAGRLAHEAARRRYSVFAMDNSHGMLLRASSICNQVGEPKVTFFQGNIEALPLQVSTFDMIVCLGVIGYIKSEEAVLLELARVLRPGGILFISIVNKARLVSRLDVMFFLTTKLKRLMRGVTRFEKKNSDINKAPFFKTYFIPKFKKSLELAGFTVSDYRTVPLRLMTFNGKEILPLKVAVKITLFFEKFLNIPIIGSFGGMCIFKAEKNLD